MLFCVLIVIILVSGSIYGVIVFDKTFEEILPITCMGIVLVLFLFGIGNRLRLGLYFIIIAITILYVISVIYFFKRKKYKTYFYNFFTPAFLIFVMLFIILYHANSGKLAVEWDEFSHWMDSVKVMTDLNDFVTNPASNSMFKTYPPGMAMFQYFFQKLYLRFPNEVFNEGLMFFVRQIFVLSLFFPFLNKLTWKFKDIVCCFAVVFLTPLTFYHDFYISIYIDSTVAVLAGCGFSMLLYFEKYAIYKIIYISLIAFTITLTKDVGAFFAIFLSVAFMYDYFKDTLFLKKYYGLRKILIALFPLIFSCTARFLWRIEIILSNAEEIVSVRNTNVLEYLRLFFLNGDISEKQQIVNGYKKAIFEKGIEIGNTSVLITYFVLLFLFIFILDLLYHKYIQYAGGWFKNKKNILNIILAQLFLYIISMGTIYIYNLSITEGIKLHSYERYMNISFLLFYIVIIIGFLTLLINHSVNNKNIKIGLLIGGLVITTPLNIMHGFLERDYVNSSISLRSQYELLTNKIQSNCTKNDKIYFISQERDVYDYRVMKFNARPSFLGGEGKGESWSIGEPFYEGDTRTVYFTAEEWRRILLQEYDYLALFHINEYFIENYGEIFSDPSQIDDNTLFFVNKSTGYLEKCPE